MYTQSLNVVLTIYLTCHTVSAMFYPFDFENFRGQYFRLISFCNCCYLTFVTFINIFKNCGVCNLGHLALIILGTNFMNSEFVFYKLGLNQM